MAGTIVGKRLAGRYIVESFLGRDGRSVQGMGRGAWHLYLAMKVLHDDLAHDRVFLRRFGREANTLAKLQHPNVVRFYEMEKDGRLVFILMDYVEGMSLRR